MSTLNFALQCVGLLRREMPKDCKQLWLLFLGELCTAGKKVSDIRDQLLDSLSPYIMLLHDLFIQAQWKDQKLERVR